MLIIENIKDYQYILDKHFDDTEELRIQYHGEDDDYYNLKVTVCGGHLVGMIKLSRNDRKQWQSVMFTECYDIGYHTYSPPKNGGIGGVHITPLISTIASLAELQTRKGFNKLLRWWMNEVMMEKIELAASNIINDVYRMDNLFHITN